jgi:hypothetical protein
MKEFIYFLISAFVNAAPITINQYKMCDLPPLDINTTGKDLADTALLG